MADDTKIQWTDSTWNPIRGCSRISPGCGGPNKEGGCYAEKVAARFIGPGMAFEGYAKRVNGEAHWTGKMGLVEHMLDQPLRWKRPRRIFVNSMSDLFHENLPDAAIDQVFAVMALAPQHTFQILTKRADRMRAYVSSGNPLVRLHHAAAADIDGKIAARFRPWANIYSAYVGSQWPLPNVWLGVSVEDQERADERIPNLLATPAAKRFLSCEPLLGPLDLCRLPFTSADPRHKQDALTGQALMYATGVDGHPDMTVRTQLEKPMPHLDWIIIGGESGPRPRANWTPNIRSIVRQCQKAGVAVFVKQMGANVQDRNDAGFEGCEPHEWPDVDPADVEHDVNGYREEHQGAACRIRLKDRKGGDPEEWPSDLRVREFPA